MKKIFILFLSFLFIGVGFSQDSLKTKKMKPVKSFLRNDRPWTMEIPIWVPGFRGEFAYGEVTVEAEDGQFPGEPEQPIEPPPPGEPPWGNGNIFSRLFTSSAYLKFFFMSRIAWEKNRFLLQTDMFSGAVGNKVNFRYNDKTVVQANFRTVLLRFMAGYAILDLKNKKKNLQYELFAYGGVRVHFMKVYSDLDRSLFNKLDINPAWTEPLIGFQNQLTLKNWFFIIQGDYGGYFVKSKGSFMFNVVAYYRLSNLLSAKVGWTDWDIKHSGNVLGEDLNLNVHLSGPAMGLNFHF